MAKRFFQMVEAPTSAEIVIYGDICSYPWDESDVSSWGLSQRLAALPDTVEEVTVRINSYGGEVAEGVAIYNALRACKARVTTVCDGFACSIASVIFMAGEERVMSDASLLMIHNASSWAGGDAPKLRKLADDLDTITGLSRGIYLAATDLDEAELTRMMDDETWLTPEFCVEHGFATAVESSEASGPAQSARFNAKQLVELLTEQVHAKKPKAEREGRTVEAKLDAIMAHLGIGADDPAESDHGIGDQRIQAQEATHRLAEFFGRI
ncbi:head maturation protease, ClpP-related [Berryella intestinalis]|uniref:head maturation protease, ClpP-related n=1 Tax=Berryella intestinalis TaxID=1531429 RepID=UPI00068C16D8|nr:head maturation protease, ClpP-related [Berryella intestinalis]